MYRSGVEVGKFLEWQVTGGAPLFRSESNLIQEAAQKVACSTPDCAVEPSYSTEQFLPFLKFCVHGDILLTLWLITAVVLFNVVVTSAEIRLTRTFKAEFIYEAALGIVSGQLGESNCLPWLPLTGTLLTLLITANWAGALVPWKLVTLPFGELRSIATDPNVPLALSIITSITYIYAGLKEKGLLYFATYVSPSPVFLPITVLEDFTKPLSLSFRLFGNLLADEIIAGVLVTIYPYLLPVPLMLTGLIGATLQGIVFPTLTAAYIEEVVD
jgi:F-type H+-transporting ATPase subunit a